MCHTQGRRFVAKLKQTLLILLILLIIFPNLSKVYILIDFTINHDFITKVLCINKDEPELKCNGKCYLSKQLKKADSQKQEKVPILQEEKIETLYCERGILNLQMPDSYDNEGLQGFYANFYSSQILGKIFKPPQINVI